MKRVFIKTICLFLALTMTLGLSGCELLMASNVPELSDEVENAVTENIGQKLAETYKADSYFALNSVRDASFNPFTTTSAWNRMVSMLMYEPLVKADSNFEAQPSLITRWASEDGSSWTFYLDTTRMFHDGGHLTAQDAIYSVEYARNWLSRYSKRFSHVTGMYSNGDDNFTVTLDEPNWRFYELMTIPCIEFNTGGADIPPGTGPYVINNGRTALSLFKDYPYASEMSIEKIYLRKYTKPEDIREAFETSRLDMVINSPADMSSLGYASTNITKYVETSNLHYIAYNADSKLFSQPMYRALITYAIDRNTIVSNAMQSAAVATTLPIHPNSALYPKQIAASLEYSEENLQYALDNLMATDTDNDGVLEFGGIKAEIIFLVCSDSAAKVTAARQIANKLRSAGFSIVMREMNQADYQLALEKGDFDMYYAEVKLCNDWDLSPLFTSNSLNYGKLQDSSLLNFYRDFLASGPEMIADNTQTLFEYFAQAAPITPICFEKLEVLYHRGVLGTITPSQDNYFNDMHLWTVNLD